MYLLAVTAELTTVEKVAGYTFLVVILVATLMIGFLASQILRYNRLISSSEELNARYIALNERKQNLIDLLNSQKSIMESQNSKPEKGGEDEVSGA